MTNLDKTIQDGKSPVRLVLKAEIYDASNELVTEQTLEFKAHSAPALHHAIQNMGSSFLYGLGHSASAYCDTVQKSNK
jgi:hypothetical protein